MDSTGIVREFDPAQGFGVIDSPETPGGCWVHFSAIVMDGYRKLEPGEEVSFAFEPARQDGFSYRATEVRKQGSQAPGRGHASAHPQWHHRYQK